MKRPPAMASPSGRAPEQGSRWDLFGTEACGGDKILLEVRRMVSVFIGIYGGGNQVKAVLLWAPHGRGVRPPPGRATCPCGPLVAHLDSSRSFQCFLLPKKIVLNRQRILTSVDIDFLRNQKQAENRNWHCALN